MNSVILAEWFDDHWYRITKDGIDSYIASVTTKLGVERKYALEKWRGDVGNREADLKMVEAQNRGKRIHRAMEIFLAGGIVLYNPWNRPVYQDAEIERLKKDANGQLIVLIDQGEMVDVWKLQRFFEIVNPEILFSERIVYSIPESIAGTLDIAMKIESGSYLVNGSKPLIIPKTGIYITDLKTGRTVDPHVWRQLAPYAFAYEKMGLGQPAGALILHTQAETAKGIPGFGVKICMRNELPPYLEDFFHLSAIWNRNNPNSGPTIFQFPTLIKRRQT